MKLKRQVIDHYGGPRCVCCGETNMKFLTLDHVEGGGNADYRQHGYGESYYLWLTRNGFPAILQVMCYNCNLGRGHNGGICPHTED